MPARDYDSARSRCNAITSEHRRADIKMSMSDSVAPIALLSANRQPPHPATLGRKHDLPTT